MIRTIALACTCSQHIAIQCGVSSRNTRIRGRCPDGSPGRSVRGSWGRQRRRAHCPQAPCFPPARTGAAWAPRRALGGELCCVAFPSTLQWARTPPRAPAEPHGPLGRVSGDSRAGGPQTTRRQRRSCLLPGVSAVPPSGRGRGRGDGRRPRRAPCAKRGCDFGGR